MVDDDCHRQYRVGEVRIVPGCGTDVLLSPIAFLCRDKRPILKALILVLCSCGQRYCNDV